MENRIYGLYQVMGLGVPSRRPTQELSRFGALRLGVEPLGACKFRVSGLGLKAYSFRV